MLPSDTIKKGIERAPHRSLFKAMGYTDEELAQPLVAVVSSANEIIPGHIHLDKVVEAAKAGVRLGGGTPVQFSVIGICDGIAMGHAGMHYSLASREIIAASVELEVLAHCFDAMVLVPNCDKIVPGMLMAAARINLPSICVSGGPMLAGRHRGKDVDFITVMEAQGAASSGRMSEEELKELEDNACPGCGSCAGLFTANSMNCLTEAVGMGLPGNGTIPAVYSARLRLAKYAGMTALRLIEKGLRPRDIINKASLRNALAVDMAIGGSSNTVLHLLAIAHEAGSSSPSRRYKEFATAPRTWCVSARPEEAPITCRTCTKRVASPRSWESWPSGDLSISRLPASGRTAWERSSRTVNPWILRSSARWTIHTWPRAAWPFLPET